MYHAVNES